MAFLICLRNNKQWMWKNMFKKKSELNYLETTTVINLKVVKVFPVQHPFFGYCHGIRNISPIPPHFLWGIYATDETAV